MINPPQETTNRYDVYLGDKLVFAATYRANADQVVKALNRYGRRMGSPLFARVNRVTVGWFFGMAAPWPVEARYSVSALGGKLVWGWAVSEGAQRWISLAIADLPVSFKRRILTMSAFDQ